MMMQTMNSRSQQGVALVAILVVVAIGSVLAVSMIREQQAAIEATRGFLTRGQAMQYALGGEEIGRQILHQDLVDSGGVDHLLEPWANPELSFEYEEGEVLVSITDLQGLINVNGLSQENPAQNVARQWMFLMLDSFGIDTGFVDRILDWMDADTSARAAGAEDFEYLVYDPPYRASNSLFSDVSEIRLLGLPPELFAQIRPYLTAIPSADAPLNINTAPAEVLQSLSQGLTYEASLTLVERRQEQEGFESVEAFRQAPELAGLGVDGDGLGVQSSFFEIRTIARYRDRFSYLTSIVHRNPTDGSMRVVQRSYSKNLRPSASGEQSRE